MEHLLNATEKETVVEAFDRTYRRRNVSNNGVGEANGLMPLYIWLQKTFEIPHDQARELFEAIRDLIKDLLYFSADACKHEEILVEILDKHLSENLDKRMQNLIKNIVRQRISIWRNASIHTRVSLPRYVSANYRVDLQTASESINHLSVPTALVQLQIQDEEKQVGTMPIIDHVDFEMNKESLSTLLDSLSTIESFLTNFSGPGSD
mmetsp:Transcript_20886/g.25302  ORF Transcript_20886/g.25302 Transcript_20886/m.25302 type:complete len:207 (+) Transcript_20886:54-674(+)